MIKYLAIHAQDVKNLALENKSIQILQGNG